MESLTDPESLLDRDDIRFSDETVGVDKKTFEEFDSIEGIVIVGVTNTKGEVLLMEEDRRGWTLPNEPVEPGKDWVLVAQHAIKKLTNVPIEIEDAEQVRRNYYTVEDEGLETLSYNVVLRASRVDERVADRMEGGVKNGPNVKWFKRPPRGAKGNIANDIRIFLD